MDFRLETGVYDKILSVEMIEAVGHEFLPNYFKIIRDRLRPGGIAAIQVHITLTLPSFPFITNQFSGYIVLG